MAEQHRATSEEWARVKARPAGVAFYSCLLELRDRVEALEAAAKSNHPAKPDSSLVERVAAAIVESSEAGVNWEPEARAAICEVAAWLREEKPHMAGNCSYFASSLEQEAER